MAWHRSSRHSRGYGAEWDRLRELVLTRDCGLCQACKRAGRVTVAREVDHILPKSRGGTDALDNLQALCSPCHQVKTLAETGRRARGEVGLDGWPLDLEGGGKKV